MMLAIPVLDLLQGFGDGLLQLWSGFFKWMYGIKSVIPFRYLVPWDIRAGLVQVRQNRPADVVDLLFPE